MNVTDSVDLLQDGHEAGKDSGEEDASKGDGGIAIIAEGQEMESSVCTSNNHPVIIEVYFAFADDFGGLDGHAAFLVAHISLVDIEGLFNRRPAMFVDVPVCRDGMNLAINSHARPDELFVLGNERHVGVVVDRRNLRAQNGEAFAARCKHLSDGGRPTQHRGRAGQALQIWSLEWRELGRKLVDRRPIGFSRGEFPRYLAGLGYGQSTPSQIFCGGSTTALHLTFCQPIFGLDQRCPHPPSHNMRLPSDRVQKFGDLASRHQLESAAVGCRDHI